MKMEADEDMYNIRRLTPYTKVDALNHGDICNMPTILRRSARQQASGIKD